MIPIMSDIKEWEQNEAIQTLKECGLTQGMNVLDFGCGAPHYAFPAAKIVGDTGMVYTVDKDVSVIEHIQKRMADENVTNTKPILLDDRGMSTFQESIQFVMYYDLFHSIGKASKGMDNRLLENQKLFHEFHRLLTHEGLLSFAVYNEITYVQDPVNGPFTPKGSPKWHHVSYEEAFEKYYRFVPFIESCGYQLRNIVKNGGVHFDEIDTKLHLKKVQTMRLSKIERKDIYNFVKV